MLIAFVGARVLQVANFTNATGPANCFNYTYGYYCTPGNSEPNDVTRKTPLEIVRDVSIILLAGIAIVLALIGLTYLVALVFDRLCCCCPWFVPLGSVEDLDQGTVSRKAGLHGLRKDERLQILAVVFQNTTFTYRKENESTVQVRNGSSDEHVAHSDKAEGETPDPEVGLEDVALNTQSMGQEGSHLMDQHPINDGTKWGLQVDGSVQSEAAEGTPSDASEQVADPQAPRRGDEQDDGDVENTCSICLNAYEEGCQIMTGTKCSHRFHYDCAMQWLEKHDLCCYCRGEMMSPEEMRAAAVGLFGQRRLAEMGVEEPSIEEARGM